MKKAVLMAMYSSNYSKNEFKTVFEEVFPDENSIFREIKKGRKKFTAYNGKEFSPNAVLPILLQRLESFIFINHIAREIITEHPTILMIPLHDAIVTNESNVNLIKEIIVRNIEKLTGFIPTINSEPWE